MTDLKDVLLTDILPEIFVDLAKLKAYSVAERKVRRIIYEYAERTMIFRNLENLPGTSLDLLAEEMDTPYYESSLPTEIKAKLIRNTLPWKMKAGTLWAVQGMVETIFKTGTVTPWYDYGGRPYFFKISTDAEVSPERLEEIRKMIHKIKNTETTLESIVFLVDLEQNVKIKSGVTVDESVCIFCEEVENVEV